MSYHPSDSRIQRRAEGVMLAWLTGLLGTRLESKRIQIPPSWWIQVDGFSESPPILVEAWAHQGPPKSAQKNKVMSDAVKLTLARNQLGLDARLILLFADQEAARPFADGSWRAAALAEAGIDVVVAELKASERARILAAQEEQYR